MLEIKGLNKTYKSENGKHVKALNDVNLSFADNGLVFILGKSGSGKSTFLNVLGGLDSFDSGEIIINGSSSAKFSPSDFDSYRNTYLGFIFQEFHILDNFSVAKNIMLALQLQQKQATERDVDLILKLVDLEGYGKRRPYELSGGQKQRVAIARALIKNPSVILADEPTGALDDNTGTQVFETLKKLSKDKLVIVVSHNRDFAEIYADRIIELADGCVISDKTREAKAADDEIILEDGIILEKGKRLSKKQIERLNDLIVKADGDVYISVKNKEEVIREIRIVNESKKEVVFQDTVMEKIEGKKDGLKLIKSRLPFGDVLKMAFSSFFSKKFRLVITLLLSVLSLVCFGFSVMLSGYDKEVSYAKTYYEGDAYYMTVNRTEKLEGVEDSLHLPFGKADVEYLENKFSDGIIKTYDLVRADFNDLNGKKDIVDTAFYDRIEHPVIAPTGFDGVIEAQPGTLEIIFGNYPRIDTECCISDLFAEYFIKYGMRLGSEGKVYRMQIDNFDQLIGKKIVVGGNEYVISGVFETNYAEYRNVFEGKSAEDVANSVDLSVSRNNYKTDEAMFMTKILVLDGYVTRFSKDKYTFDADLILRGDVDTGELPYGSKIERDVLYDLKQGEIYLSASYYRTAFYGSESTKTYKELCDDILNNSTVSLYLRANKDVRSTTEIFSESFEVKGLIDDLYGTFDPVIVMNGNDFEKIMEAKYTPQTVLVDANLSTTDLHNRLSDLHSEGYITYARNDEALQVVDELMESFTVILYILACVMAVFVILILFNFVSTSIAYKTKEIGILRALGARSLDVVGIFVFEGLLLAIVITGISIPITYFTTNMLVSYLYEVLPVSLISFTSNIIGLMVALAFAIIIVSSFIPVMRIAKKKPVEAIRTKEG